MRIVIGGYHATLMYEEIAASDEAPLIDFIVRGEGEEAFRRLVNALDGADGSRTFPPFRFTPATGSGTIHAASCWTCPSSRSPSATSAG